MARQQGSSGLGFFGMVGMVMAGLKLKERWDEYRQLPNDEEGRVALRETNDAAARDSEERERLLLDTELPTPTTRRARKKSCCMCCGVDCSLFWKAFGIVLGLVVLYNLFRFVVWVVTPSPTGLENMPAYSSSLGCLDAPHIYNGSTVTYQVPANKDFRHSLDIRGSGVGTLVVRPGTLDNSDIRYEMTLRTTDESLLSQVTVKVSENTDEKSHITFYTPTPDINAAKDCSRFDIVMYVPPNLLSGLAIASHSVIHLLFDVDETNIDLDALSVTLFASSTDNQLLPHARLHAKEMNLEIFRGWLVGEVTVAEATSLKSQQGDGTINVKAKILPYKSDTDTGLPPVEFRTATGSGRTDLFVSGDKGFPHRRIEAQHISARNGDLYLMYKDAEFNGRVALSSKSYSTTGLSSLPASEGSDDGKKWTHYVGDAKGEDKLSIDSRGWTGLYF